MEIERQYLESVPKMNRWIVTFIVVGAIGAAGWWGWNYYQEQQAAEAAATAAAEAAASSDLEQVIWASGKLTPVQWAGLAPSGSGTVAAIYVQELSLIHI